MVLQKIRIQVLHDMRGASLPPSDVSISAALMACEISGEWEKAIQMMVDFMSLVAEIFRLWLGDRS